MGMLALGLASCGVGSTPTVAPTIDVSGQWVVDLKPSDSSEEARMRLTLTQSGATVTGDAEAAYYSGTLIDLYEPFGKVNGTVSGDRYTLNVAPQGKYSGSLTLSGTVIAGKLSGTWSAVGSNGQSRNGAFQGSKQ